MASKSLIIPGRTTLSEVAWKDVESALGEVHEVKSVVLYQNDGLHLRIDVQTLPRVFSLSTIVLYRSAQSPPLLVGRHPQTISLDFPPVLSGDRAKTASAEFWPASGTGKIEVFRAFYEDRPIAELYSLRDPRTEYSREEIRQYLMAEAPLPESR